MIKEVSASAPNMANDRFALSHNCANCEIRDGIPRTKGWGYYASRNGTQMLVVERRPDQRIRINGTIEIIVLETDNNKVRLGIEGVPGVDAHAGE